MTASEETSSHSTGIVLTVVQEEDVFCILRYFNLLASASSAEGAKTVCIARNVMKERVPQEVIDNTVWIDPTTTDDVVGSLPPQNLSLVIMCIDSGMQRTCQMIEAMQATGRVDAAFAIDVPRGCDPNEVMKQICDSPKVRDVTLVDSSEVFCKALFHSILASIGGPAVSLTMRIM